MRLSVTTGGSFSTTNDAPHILWVRAKARSATIWQAVIPADDNVLKDGGLTKIDAGQNLRRLQSQGPVTFLEPGTSATFNAEVTEVANTTYQTTDGIAHGIRVTFRSFVTD